jgi:hypothetical protein
VSERDHRNEYHWSTDYQAAEDEAHPDQSLTSAQRLLIKRAKIDVSIILKESDESAKYELFQRLNTGGSQLSDQEVRNSILVMLNKEFYRWMKQLSDEEAFRDTVGLSERATEEQYDMELVLRFIALRTLPNDDLARIRELGEFLTEKAAELADPDMWAFRRELLAALAKALAAR